MRDLRAIVNGSLTIAAFTDPEVRSSSRVNGEVEISFRNFPLDPEHVSMFSDTLIQLIERVVEPPDAKA